MLAARSRRSPVRSRNVLFLCTANSARSIIAEAILNRLGVGRFTAYSAGSHPAGAVDARAKRVLEHYNFRTGNLRSKSWDEFTAAGSPPFHFVITLCDEAAGQACPVWMSSAVRIHWSLADPSKAAGGGKPEYAAFAETYARLYDRIAEFAGSTQ